MSVPDIALDIDLKACLTMTAVAVPIILSPTGVWRARWGLLLLGFLACSSDQPPTLQAQELIRGARINGTDINWVDEGARSLSKTTRFPWYDSSRDDVRPVHPLPPRDLAGNRHSAWEDADRPPTPARNWNWSGGAFGEMLRIISWVILILAALLLAFALGWALILRESAEAQGTRRREFAIEKVAWQMERLPFDLDPENLDLLGEAKRCFSAGDYRRAIIFLFGYQLAYLDQHQLIHLERGRTNRQYLHELHSHPQLSSLFEPTMILFEDVFFGGKSVARGQLVAAWARLEAFHQQLEPHSP